VYHAFRNALSADEFLIDPTTQEYAHPKISTIKGGTVYGSTGITHFAIKVFKTSILIFKDRERYVEGEFRFRRGTH
jgi:serine/threonine-protein kinase RIO1